LLRIRDNLEESDILLTAAHCVVKDGTVRTPYDADRYQAIAGNHRRDTYDIGEQLRLGSEIRVHPQYTSFDFRNDVALIKLDKPIRFTDTIRPICLADQDEELPIGKTCVAAGWGHINTVTKQVPNVLQQLKVEPIHDPNTCRNAYRNQFGITSYVENEMLCAGKLAGGEDTCQGDSGGMLACEQPNNGGWKLYGVTSFGRGCAEAGAPGVYARVSSYVNWINDNKRQMTSLPLVG
jgi:secreted trypsin-like serine protease